MKKNITNTALAFIIVLGFNSLFAGAGHDHGHGHSHSHMTKVTKIQAVKASKKEIKKYVKKGKLVKSWLKVKVNDVSQKKYHGHLEWVITYKNSEIKDAKKQQLYVFINEIGHSTGANFTGE